MNFFEATMAIGAAEKLDIETAELLIRVENSGDVLYNELASRLNNEEAADLLRKNGREEVGHARRMMKVLSLKLGTEYVPSAEVLEKFEVDLPDSLDASSLPMMTCKNGTCHTSTTTTRKTKNNHDNDYRQK